MSTQPEPYVGPRPFFERDAEYFHGRERELNTLRSLVVAHPAILIYGPSGAGKSSLVHAGLVARLRHEGFDVLPAIRLRAGAELSEGVGAESANPYVFRALLSLAGEGDHDPAALVRMTLAEFLSRQEPSTAGDGAPGRRVIIFDQLEELFAEIPYWEARQQFFEQVQEALEQERGLRVVFVILEEYLGALEPYADYLEERLRTRFRVEPLRAQAALAAVERPLLRTGHSFAPGVAERLVEQLMELHIKSLGGEVVVMRSEFVEPLQLQLAAQKLWRALPEGVAVVTEDHLAVAGDPEQALSSFYEKVIAEVSQKGVDEDALRIWFERELITPVGTRGLVYVGEEGVAGLSARVIKMLEDSHLIRPELRGGSVFYELAHDRFIQPILGSNREWLLQQPLERQQGRRLEERAANWVRSERPRDLLLDNDDLKDAERWLDSPEATSFGHSETLLEYVRMSRVAHQRKGIRHERLLVWIISFQFLLIMLLLLLLLVRALRLAAG